jgi:hypothetical protein
MAKPSFPERVETERMLLRCSVGAAGILDFVHSDRDKLIREFSQLSGLQDLQEAQQRPKRRVPEHRAPALFPNLTYLAI